MSAVANLEQFLKPSAPSEVISCVFTRYFRILSVFAFETN